MPGDHQEDEWRNITSVKKHVDIINQANDLTKAVASKLLKHNKQPVARSRSEMESSILSNINNCFRAWHEPWKNTYLAGGREFLIVYSLMDGLLHYEELLTTSEKSLSLDRTNKIAQAVARLIDYGNAILNLDLIIRANDEASSELNAADVTTIELFKAHVQAHKLKEKLLYDYFKKDKPIASEEASSTTSSIYAQYSSSGGQSQTSPFSTLRLHPNYANNSNNRSGNSPTAERSLKSSSGSNTSINNVSPDGSRTPANHIEVKTQTDRLNAKPIEISHMAATMRSAAFTASHGSETRLRLLPQIIAKIESLSWPPNTSDKMSSCFELLDLLLDSIEKLPLESRENEIAMIASKLLEPILERINVDDRDEASGGEFQHSHWTTCLASIIGCMTAKDFEAYANSFQSKVDFKGFLKDYLFIVRRFTAATNTDSVHRARAQSTSHHHHNATNNNAGHPNGHQPAGSSSARKASSSCLDQDEMMLMMMIDDKTCEPTYASCWIEMILRASGIFFRSLTFIHLVLRNNFASDTQMWSDFIECLISFLRQDALRPERPMLNASQLKQANDLRHMGADYVHTAWHSLDDDQRLQLGESLLEPIVHVCLLLPAHQRLVLLPILYDMMRCEYASSCSASHAHAHKSPSTSAASASASRPLSVSAHSGVGSELSSNSNSNSNSHSSSSGGISGVTLRDDYYIGDDDLESLPPARGPNSTQGDNSQANSTASTSPPCATMSARSRTPNSSGRPANMAPSHYQQAYADGTAGNNGGPSALLLAKFTPLIVEKLNKLCVDMALGDQEFRTQLCDAIAGDFDLAKTVHHSASRLSQQFRLMAKQTSSLVGDFLLVALDLKLAQQLAFHHLHLLCIFKLIAFFRDKVHRPELYLANVHKLSQLHHVAYRYVEAGYTLLEHARRLPWSTKPLEPHHRIVSRFFQTSPSQLSDSTSLKVFLYNIVIDYFEQGQLWEAAMPLCRELIDVYEFRTFEFERLASLLERMASFVANMIEPAKRSYPEYFRITFYGLGFPECLRDLTMVYRGKPFEKLQDFQATMLAKYPDSRLLNYLGPPESHVLVEPAARYLQINACTPLVDLAMRYNPQMLAKINESVLDYHRHNGCDKFFFNRRVKVTTSGTKASSKSEFASMWLERTTLSTERLPGLLPFTQVTATKTELVSPIRSAIEDMERTNDRLRRMLNRYKFDRRQSWDVRPLGQLLMGVVDAAVNGGVTKYEEAFFAQGDLDAGANSDDVERLKRLIASQLPILDEAIRMHSERVADVMRPQHEHLEATYKRLKQHVMANYARHLPSDYAKAQAAASRSPAGRIGRTRSPSSSRFATTSIVAGAVGGAAELAPSRPPGHRLSEALPPAPPPPPGFEGRAPAQAANNDHQQQQHMLAPPSSRCQLTASDRRKSTPNLPKISVFDTTVTDDTERLMRGANGRHKYHELTTDDDDKECDDKGADLVAL